MMKMSVKIKLYKIAEASPSPNDLFAYNKGPHTETDLPLPSMTFE